MINRLKPWFIERQKKKKISNKLIKGSLFDTNFAIILNIRFYSGFENESKVHKYYIYISIYMNQHEFFENWMCVLSLSGYHWVDLIFILIFTHHYFDEVFQCTFLHPILNFRKCWFKKPHVNISNIHALSFWNCLLNGY